MLWDHHENDPVTLFPGTVSYLAQRITSLFVFKVWDFLFKGFQQFPSWKWSKIANTLSIQLTTQLQTPKAKQRTTKKWRHKEKVICTVHFCLVFHLCLLQKMHLSFIFHMKDMKQKACNSSHKLRQRKNTLKYPWLDGRCVFLILVKDHFEG